MISGSVVVPFQRVRAARVEGRVVSYFLWWRRQRWLFLFFYSFFWSPFFFSPRFSFRFSHLPLRLQHQSKQNKIEQNQKESAKAFANGRTKWRGDRCEWNEKLLIKNRNGIVLVVVYFSNRRQLLCYWMNDSQLQ